MATSAPPPDQRRNFHHLRGRYPFDWPAFLALQERWGGNLFRMWATDGEDDFSMLGPTNPLPYARRL